MQTIEILDTTLRDGEQTQGIAFSPSEKLSIAKLLLQDLRIPRIEIASARVSQGELAAVQTIFDWAKTENHVNQIEILGFIDQHKSVDWIKQAGGSIINLLTKGSEKHCKEQLRKTLQEHVADIKDNIAYATSQNVEVNVYLEAWSSGLMENKEFVFSLVEQLQDLPIKRFMLPDTLGILSPIEAGEYVQIMVSKFPNLHFDFHAHNDYGVATANSFMAAQAGAKGVHCTLNGLGERTGNASLFEIEVLLKDKLQLETQVDESCFIRAARMVKAFTNKRIPDNLPIVGKNVFTQTSGIHADGDTKANLYQHLNPKRFGRNTSYALGKMSGKASLQQNLNLLGIELNEEERQAVLQKIITLGDSKTVLSKDDLRFIVADILGSTQYKRLELLDYAIHSSKNLHSTASIRVLFDSKEHLATGSGNGGYDAFMQAIQSITQTYNFVFPKLVDYEIIIPQGGESSALTICHIHWQTDKQEFETIGLHSNQVFASIEATIKMINLCLEEK